MGSVQLCELMHFPLFRVAGTGGGQMVTDFSAGETCRNCGKCGVASLGPLGVPRACLLVTSSKTGSSLLRTVSSLPIKFENGKESPKRQMANGRWVRENG